MLVSMTGFASLPCSLKLSEHKSLPCTLEIKSLNARFFESSCKLPSSMASLETELVTIFKRSLLRGRIFFTLILDERECGLESIDPSLSVVGGYIKALEKIKKSYSISGTLSISDLVSLPGVFAVHKESISEKVKKELLEWVEKLAQKLMKERMREGALLEKDLKERFSICAKSMKLVVKHAAELMKEQKKNLAATLESLQMGNEEAKQKSIDLYALLNKIDINEEITRFNSHLSSTAHVLASKELEKGKRLEFILQELLRETNTIAAKCSHVGIASATVDIKVELEKAREQVQNIL